MIKIKELVLNLLSCLPVTEASISWFALMTDSELGCE